MQEIDLKHMNELAEAGMRSQSHEAQNKGCKGKIWRFYSILFVLQMAILILFGFFVRYGPDSDEKLLNTCPEGDEECAKTLKKNNCPWESVILRHYYPMFQDVHVMIFVGFGYLMTFLKRYGYGSVSFNFLIAAFGIQWSTLVIGFFHLHDGKVWVDISTMLGSDFCMAAVLISYGAVLGKVSPIQLIVMTMFEVVLFMANEHIGRYMFYAVDMGDSIFVHMFGAYFGMAVARVLWKESIEEFPAEDKEEPTYHSDIFSILGTLFLWMYWPSFNAGLAPESTQQRAVINTYYALCGSTIACFIMSSLINEDGKFQSDHIQNSTLAGGVAVGAVADLMLQPWGAMVIGMVAGTISVLGFRFLQPALNRFLKIHDTCGVHNLHGMPGVIAAVASVIMAAMATEDVYGKSLYDIYPTRVESAPYNATDHASPAAHDECDHGIPHDRSPGYQAAMQAAAIGVTFAFAIIGGAITGAIMKIPIWSEPDVDEMFDDEPFWLIPMEGFPHVFREGAPIPNKGDRPFDTEGRRMSIGGVYHHGSFVEDEPNMNHRPSRQGDMVMKL